MTRYWPPLPTEDQLTTAGLTADGRHIQGWVRVPTGKVWQPEDLLWLPPSATKSTDVDRAGRVVDVTLAPDEVQAWVTSQIAVHDKYLDWLRQKVRAGALKLTAALARMLGLDFEDGVELVPRGGGPLVAYKSLRAEPDREPAGPIWTPPKRQWVN
jgi:hypothetical protein